MIAISREPLIQKQRKLKLTKALTGIRDVAILGKLELVTKPKMAPQWSLT